MYLHRIRIINFKNIKEATLDFSPKINCILGDNGGGKTNLLDAIYYLSMTKSFFNIPESYAVTFGQHQMGLIGEYNQPGQQNAQEKVHLGINLPDGASKTTAATSQTPAPSHSSGTADPTDAPPCAEGATNLHKAPTVVPTDAPPCAEGATATGSEGAVVQARTETATPPCAGGATAAVRAEKSLWLNDKRIPRFASHIGRFPIVMVSPQDSVLINGPGEERRKMLNFILSQTDPLYLSNVQRYNALLVQRNKLLKMCAGAGAAWEELIETITMQMVAPATYMHRKRAELAASLRKYTAEGYKELSGGKERISMSYESDLNAASPEELFSRTLQRDLRAGFTTAGPHRDDINFTIEGFPIKKVGSQGQQKSFLIALKLAQFQIMKEIGGKTPILLLDDLFDKLDMQRVECLLALVAGETFGQIFITDSNKVRINQILQRVDSTAKSFTVHDGTYQEATLVETPDASEEAGGGATTL